MRSDDVQNIWIVGSYQRQYFYKAIPQKILNEEGLKQ